MLGLRPGNKSAFVAKENLPGELDGAEQMLERLALSAASNEFPQRRQLRFGQGAFELQIKVEPFPPQNMREQMLRVQPRAFYSTLLEIAGRRLQHLKKRHSG